MALTRADIVRAATRLAGEKGAAALTMRGVARELGVSPMALYNHVENRSDLVNAIADSFTEYILGSDEATLAEHARRVFAAYRQWPYIVELLRESGDERREASVQEMLDGLGLDASGRARAAEDWVAMNALAQGLVEYERAGGSEDVEAIFERFARDV